MERTLTRGASVPGAIRSMFVLILLQSRTDASSMSVPTT